MEGSQSPSSANDKIIMEAEETDVPMDDSAMAGSDNENNNPPENMEEDNDNVENDTDGVEGNEEEQSLVVVDDDEEDDIMDQEGDIKSKDDDDDTLSVQDDEVLEDNPDKSTESEVQVTIVDVNVQTLGCAEEDAQESPEAIVEQARRESQGMNEAELFSELESNYISLKSEHDSLKTQYENQSNYTQELEATIFKLRQELSDNAKVIGKNSLDMEDVRLATERNQRLELEGDSLREEISRLSEANSTLQKNLSKLQAESTLTSSSVMPLKLELDRVKKENESITEHSSWLENELEQRNESIASLKSIHSQQIISLQTQNDTLYAEKETVQSRFISLQRDVESIQEQINSLQHEKLELQRQHADALYAKEEELSAETQMTKLLQQKNDELNYRFETKCNECHSMRLLLDKINEERDALQNQLSEEKQALVQTITDRDATLADVSHQLRLKNDENEKLTNDLNLLVSNPPQNNMIETSITVQPEDRASLPPTMTDLLDRLSETEAKLNKSNSNCRRYELILQRLQLDIEQKAPKLKQQRKEYEIALESQQRANDQLVEVMRELEAAKEEVEYIKMELKECKQNLDISNQEGRDLAVQVQSLLRENSSDDDLIEIGSIGDLQNKNQRLVKEYRILTNKLQELQAQLDDDTVHSSLELANEELNALKEEQRRQESIVAGIVQQRDLYRALLSQKDEEALKKMEQSANASAGKVDEKISKELVTLRTELATTKNECQSLTERNERLDMLQSDLSTSITKYQQELTTANSKIAKAQAETAFYKQRYERLEQSYENAKRELEYSSNKSKEMQEINSKMEKIVGDSKANVSRYEQELRQVRSKLKLLETQLQASIVAETRAKLELEKVQAEVAQQTSLQQSLQNIELSLSSKSNAETQSLKEDVQRLTASLTTERANHASSTESMMDRIRDYELQVMNLQKVQHDSADKYLKQTEEVKKLESDVNTHKKKCVKLEKELLDTKSSLATVTSGKEVIAKSKYDDLQVEFDATKEELLTLQERSKDYQTAARDAEKLLAEIQTATNNYKDRVNKQLQELQSSYDASKKSSEEKGEIIKDLTNDLLKVQREQTKCVTSYKEQIATLSNDLECKKQDIQQMKVQVDDITSELSKLREENASAQRNYERELGLHANARTELRTTKAEVDVERERRAKIENELKSIQLSVEAEKNAWEEKEKKLMENIEALEQRLDGSRKQSSLLHNQVSSLTATLEKAQKEELDNVMETSTTEDGEEIARMRKSLTEYRGIVDYMRSEREQMEKQIESLKMKLKSQEAAATIAKATLDESKLEIQTLQKQLSDLKEKEPAFTAPDDVVKQSSVYKEASEQLVLLRESNIVLREQSERANNKLEASLREIAELKQRLEPLEKELSNFEVEKESWTKERESLQRETEVWRVRVQNFISKLNQVDLQEHEKVLADAAALKKEVDVAKSDKDRLEQESAGAKKLITQLNSQVAELKRTLDKYKSDEDKPKLIKERDEAQASLKKLTADYDNVNTELTSTKGRVENLTKILRQNKNALSMSLSKEADMQKSLDKERETCKKLMISLDTLKKSVASSPQASKADEHSNKVPVVTTDKESLKDAPGESLLSAKQSTEVPSGGFKFSASAKSETKVVDLTEDSKDEKEPGEEDDSAPVDKSESATEVEKSNLESSMKAKEAESQPQDTKSNEESMRKKLLLKRKKELEVTLLNKKEEVKESKDSSADNVTGDAGRKRLKTDEEQEETEA